MYSATIKFLITFIVVVNALSFTSCSESETTCNARSLYEQARSLNIDGNPSAAIVLLDSLQHTYPAETEIQREAMKLRPTLIINSAEQKIIQLDDSIAEFERSYSSLLPVMKRVADPRLVEPYYVDAATYNAEFMKTTGVQPRVSEIGQFYFVSSVNGENLKHTGFTLNVGAESVTVGPVAYDGEMNYRINGSEVVTYSPESSNPAGELAANNLGLKASIILNGAKSRTINLTSKQLQAIANCYLFSKSIVDARQLAFEKEHLAKQIEIARSQAERLAQ